MSLPNPTLSDLAARLEREFGVRVAMESLGAHRTPNRGTAIVAAPVDVYRCVTQTLTDAGVPVPSDLWQRVKTCVAQAVIATSFDTGKVTSTAPAVCPRCGSTVFHEAGLGFWDGIDTRTGRSASGASISVRCAGCNQAFRTFRCDENRPADAVWHPVDDAT